MFYILTMPLRRVAARLSPDSVMLTSPSAQESMVLHSQQSTNNNVFFFSWFLFS